MKNSTRLQTASGMKKKAYRLRETKTETKWIKQIQYLLKQQNINELDLSGNFFFLVQTKNLKNLL